MIVLRSTSVQFGGAIFTTDDPLILDKIMRLLSMIEMVAIELLLLFQVIRSSAGSLELLCRRLLGYLDWLDFVFVIAPGRAIRQMAEDWIRFWFKAGWNYEH